MHLTVYGVLLLSQSLGVNHRLVTASTLTQTEPSRLLILRIETTEFSKFTSKFHHNTGRNFLNMMLSGTIRCSNVNQFTVSVADDFTHKVWRALVEKVPFGETVTYGGLAAQCNNPGAARAIGQAMRKNPVMILVPCHRVLPAEGGTGNYASGQKNSLKAWLLEHEGYTPN